MKQAELEIILADLEKEDRIIRTISKHGELIYLEIEWKGGQESTFAGVDNSPQLAKTQVLIEISDFEQL